MTHGPNAIRILGSIDPGWYGIHLLFSVFLRSQT